MDKEPIKILRDIVKTYMSLNDSQFVLSNQDYTIPRTSELFLMIQHVNSQPYSANNYQTSTDEGMEETINMLTREEYIINVMSKNSDARTRKNEVLLALNSVYSQQQQELYQFRIAQLSSSFLNISELEGSGMLTRYAINVAVLAWERATQSIDYFETFTREEQVENY